MWVPFHDDTINDISKVIKLSNWLHLLGVVAVAAAVSKVCENACILLGAIEFLQRIVMVYKIHMYVIYSI